MHKNQLKISFALLCKDSTVHCTNFDSELVQPWQMRSPVM
jgi:hypothetical protein